MFERATKKPAGAGSFVEHNPGITFSRVQQAWLQQQVQEPEPLLQQLEQKQVQMQMLQQQVPELVQVLQQQVQHVA